MSDQFMMLEEFQLGAKVRAGKGFTCLDEGSIYTVEKDGGGNLCLRCQYKGQQHKGYHYPTDHRCRTEDGRLKEFYLVMRHLRAAHSSTERATTGIVEDRQ